MLLQFSLVPLHFRVDSGRHCGYYVKERKVFTFMHSTTNAIHLQYAKERADDHVEEDEEEEEGNPTGAFDVKFIIVQHKLDFFASPRSRILRSKEMEEATDGATAMG